MELDPEQDQKTLDKDTSSLSSYDGGVWHVEGSLGERIVATACCYLECTNVQGGALAFRTSVQEPEDYRQFDHTGVQLMYNLVTEGTLLQPSGSPCVTKQGRILAWPNTKQHCVQPVQLVDSTKPGKRTICCFFLVDPTVRIRSTATVPPQQEAWVVQAQEQEAVLDSSSSLGPALTSTDPESDSTSAKVTSSGHKDRRTSLLTYKQACERRQRLMTERSACKNHKKKAILVLFALFPYVNTKGDRIRRESTEKSAILHQRL